MPQVKVLSDAEIFLRLAKKLEVLKYGECKLSSDKVSSRCFNDNEFTLNSEGNNLVGLYFARKLIDDGIEFVGGPEHEAIPSVSATVGSSEGGKGPRIHGFYVLEEPKRNDAQYLVEEEEISTTIIDEEEAKRNRARRLIRGVFKEGVRVAIVNDVCMRGASSLFHSISVVETLGCEVALVLVILDEGGGEELRKKYDFEALLKVTKGVVVPVVVPTK